MILKELYLTNFRNYKEKRFNFDTWGAFLHGENGAGKTNVLEAIYMLAYAKSFRSNRNTDMISWNSDTAGIRGIYTDRDGLENTIELNFDKKKSAAQ